MGLNRILASGGPPVPVTKFDASKGDLSHYYPQFLPGGKEFLFQVRSSDARTRGTSNEYDHTRSMKCSTSKE